MTAELMPFHYEGAELRSFVIDGEPWFVAADVARILEYRMASDLTRRLDEEDKGTRLVRTPSGEQQMTVISEAGFYVAILGSQCRAAKSVKRWMTHEVLPMLRKTGTYAVVPADYPAALEEAARHARLAIEERQARELAEAQIEADRPLVERAKNHASGAGLKTRQQFFREVKQWALDEHGVDVKQAQVMAFLSTRKLGLFARGDRADSGQATSWAIGHGYAVNKEDTTDSGRNVVTGKLTARGQDYAWERIVRFIDANGSLELPREIGAAS